VLIVDCVVVGIHALSRVRGWFGRKRGKRFPGAHAHGIYADAGITFKSSLNSLIWLIILIK